MKKKIAAMVLAGVLVRGAVLAGAGEALGDWVKELSPEGNAVSATLNVSFGGADETAPTAASTDNAETPQTAENAAEPELLLVEITPNPEETAAEAAEDCEPTVLAADLSGEVTVHNSTSLTVDFAALTAEGPSLTLGTEGPQILIFHTHSSEAYTPDGTDTYAASDPFRTEDKAYSVIRVGDALTEKLESYGLTVLHDREIYDYPSYTGSYARSGAAVEEYLKQYPTIQVVIDLHRDALGSGDVVYKTNARVDGRTSAQVMLLVGTGENGLWHPNWQENLKLALYLQQNMETKYPSLARPIELVSERYNQQMSPGMMILEVGSNGNTLREAITAVELFGDAAGEALSELMAAS